MYIKQSKTNIDGEECVIRLLKSSDEKMLTKFFKSLSDETKIKYSPHPFDRKTAIKICKLDDKKYKRVVCVCQGAIVAYCVIYFNLREWEKIRYDNAKIFLKDKDVCTIAPCVLDIYQHRGFGSKMFEYVIHVAKVYNKKIIILWGRVVIKNHHAVNYYKKMNLKILGEWLHPLSIVMCYDMYYII